MSRAQDLGINHSDVTLEEWGMFPPSYMGGKTLGTNKQFLKSKVFMPKDFGLYWLNLTLFIHCNEAMEILRSLR